MSNWPINTSQLTGTALDYAAAIAARMKPESLPSEYGTGPRLFVRMGARQELVRWRPSQDPAQAWPLLCTYGKRIRLELHFHYNGASYLEAGIRTGHTADAMLTAALRALVQFRLGPVVDVPIELSLADHERAA